MIDFKTCKARFGSPYQINKAIRDGRIFKMDKGVYSDDGSESEIEVIQMKYPRAIVSFDSAYFYYDMTDYIPDQYTLTIENHAHLVRDERVRFFFVPEEVIDVGVAMFNYDGANIRIYDKERLLIDTARMKARMPADQYKEVVNHYRACRDTLDASKFPEYLERFPHRDRIMRIIDEEVY
ncbi:MAG: hypothetical protein IJ146_09035 [Kiritimatiellae bacterium]|nr:hypothetical protein [Kiritimatiellia bacterium]